MIQFNALLDQIGKEVDWAIQMIALPVTGKIEDKTSHPLHPRLSSKESRVSQNSTNTLPGFIKKLNKLVKK